ncbi:MAG: tetratricopeptide repeat protein [Verrucomicrobiota bacterium]
MKFCPPLFLALAMLVPANDSRAQFSGTDEAADLFFQGYVLKNDAEKMEQEGNLQGALSLYQQMKQSFDDLAVTHPQWQPGMMGNRRALTEQAIVRVKGLLARPQAAPAPGAAPTGAAPAPAAGTPTTLFGMPSNGAPVAAPAAPSPAPALGGGGATTPAANGSMPSLAEVLSQWEAAYRQRMTALESQNSTQQVDLQKWQQWYQWASGEITTSRDKQQKLEGLMSSKDEAIALMKMEVAAGRASEQQLDALTKEKIAIEVEYKKAAQRLSAAESAAKEASMKLAEASQRIADVEEERNKILAERDTAVKERDAKSMALVEAEKKADSATKERDALSAQVLGYKTEVEDLRKKKTSILPNDVKKIVADHERLKKDFDDAQKQIVTLKADSMRKDEEVVKLRGQLTTLQSEMATLRQQSAAYQTQVADLTLQLKKIQDSDPTGMTPELAKENTLLREIIMRQLRSQYRQQQAKELVITDLKKMEGVSTKMLSQVEELTQNRLTLTPDEEKLFTDPAVRELLASDGIQGTLIARVSKPGDEAKNPAQALLDKANEAFSTKRFPEAAALYEDALRADPKNTTALVGLGYAREREQKYAEAETALKKCLVYEPENETAAFHLGVTYFKQDRWNDAMGSFEKSLTINPKNARGRHYLGIISTKLNFIERAEREFKTALAIDPSYGEAHFNLAVLYATWDPPQWDKARAEYDEALKKGVTPDENLEKLLKGNTEKSVSAR